eukprot:357765-Chlamydomonas_euryale.AAC.1
MHPSACGADKRICMGATCVHVPMNARTSVVGNGKRRPPFPFPRRKRPFPCGNGTAVSMWKRDVVSPAARAGRIVWAALP